MTYQEFLTSLIVRIYDALRNMTDGSLIDDVITDVVNDATCVEHLDYADLAALIAEIPEIATINRTFTWHYALSGYMREALALQIITELRARVIQNFLASRGG